MKTPGPDRRDERGEHDGLLPDAQPAGARAAGRAAFGELLLRSVDFAPDRRAAGEGRLGRHRRDPGRTRRGALEGAGAEAILICANTMHLNAAAGCGGGRRPADPHRRRHRRGAEGAGRHQRRCCSPPASRWKSRSTPSGWRRTGIETADPAQGRPRPAARHHLRRAGGRRDHRGVAGRGAGDDRRPAGRPAATGSSSAAPRSACCSTRPPCRCRPSTPPWPTARPRWTSR